MTSRREFLEATTTAALAGFTGYGATRANGSEGGSIQSSAAQPVVLAADAKSGRYDFETPQIDGSLRLDGAYHGVSRLVDKKSGRQVIDERYSALNLFRLFSANQGMGQPRSMPRTIESGENWARAEWPATDAHKGEITARYEVKRPNAVDVTITVKSNGVYRAYELFMSNYFDKTLRPYVFLKPQRGKPPGSEPELVHPSVNDVFRGTVLVFPRDAHSARHCVDGRWNRNEWGAPTVQMSPVRHYGYCLALLTDRDHKLGIALMAHPKHCYAISTRYHAENDADRLTTYSAFDFSLFGNDMLPGEERTVRVRLAVIDLQGEFSAAVEQYREFIADIGEE